MQCPLPDWHADERGYDRVNGSWLSLRMGAPVSVFLSVKEFKTDCSLHLTDAGLLSIPVMSAKVESAIISLLELDSHSKVNSCSAVCLTSTAPITWDRTCEICRQVKEKQGRAYTHGGNTVLIHTLFNAPIHSF